MDFNYVYKITNLINDKYYIGKHSTDDIDDNYFGSGKLLLRAFKKYGKENFKKEIISFCTNEVSAFALEGELVTMCEVNDPMCYNMILGGVGILGIENGFTGKQHSEETKRRMSELKKKLVGEAAPRYGVKLSDETRRKIRERAIGRKSFWKGKSIPDSTKIKVSDGLKDFFKNNSAPRNKEINMINTETGDVIKIFESAISAARHLGKSGCGNISRCANGRLKSAYGYKWEYTKL